MADEIITKQELIDAKQDARDLGVAVNESIIVTPRYGAPFKSIPMVVAGLQDAINTITVDGGVPALAVVDESSKTQQQINNSITSTVKSGLQGDNSTYDQTKYNLLLADSQEKGSPILVKNGVYRLGSNGNIARPASNLSPEQLVRKKYVDLRAGIYEPTPTPSWNPFEVPAGNNSDNITPEILHGLWGSLVAAHPNLFLWQSDLGLDASGTYPIKHLVFTGFGTPLYPNGQNKEILITTGVHGGEVAGMLGTYYFFKDLCERGAADPTLFHLWRHCRFRIIPCVNPWGLANKTRYQSEGTDINRNSDYEWDATPSGAPFDPTYKGTAPWSVVESQYLKTWYDQFAPSAAAIIDIHAYGYSADKQHYPAYCSPNGFEIMQELAGQLCRESEKYGVRLIQKDPAPINYASKKYGTVAFVPEHTDMAWHRSEFWDSNKYTSESLTGAARWYGNLIIRTANRIKHRLLPPSYDSQMTRLGTNLGAITVTGDSYVGLRTRSHPHGIDGLVKVKFHFSLKNESVDQPVLFTACPNIDGINLLEFEQYVQVPPNSHGNLVVEGVLHVSQLKKYVAVAPMCRCFSLAGYANTIKVTRYNAFVESVYTSISQPLKI